MSGLKSELPHLDHNRYPQIGSDSPEYLFPPLLLTGICPLTALYAWIVCVSSSAVQPPLHNCIYHNFISYKVAHQTCNRNLIELLVFLQAIVITMIK